MRLAIMLLVLCLFASACETTRTRDARRREQMDSYTYTYEMRPDQFGFKQMEPRDKRMLRDLEEEGWKPVREERSTKGDTEVVTVYYER
ncbi:MAG: hypothetical protein ICCCNLDF_01458 [Planctomycetes bacterium]|nr:hypothetical protein [Planctomycetota bacterium]